MGLLCDYFAAASHEDAVETIDWIGGPSHPPEGSRDTFEVVPIPGVEPTVMMGSLEALLTGRSMDEIISDLARKHIEMRDGGERLVVPWGRRWTRLSHLRQMSG